MPEREHQDAWTMFSRAWHLKGPVIIIGMQELQSSFCEVMGQNSLEVGEQRRRQPFPYLQISSGSLQ